MLYEYTCTRCDAVHHDPVTGVRSLVANRLLGHTRIMCTLAHMYAVPYIHVFTRKGAFVCTITGRIHTRWPEYRLLSMRARATRTHVTRARVCEPTDLWPHVIFSGCVTPVFWGGGWVAFYGARTSCAIESEETANAYTQHTHNHLQRISTALLLMEKDDDERATKFN